MLVIMSKDNSVYWIDIAEYDLETARALMNSRRWLYVGFMCHQVIEKALKAYWCATKPEDPPYTHNLLNLVQSSNLVKEISPEQRLFIQSIMPLNIEARYPEYKERLLRQLTPEVCMQIVEDTTAFLVWIKNKLLK